MMKRLLLHAALAAALATPAVTSQAQVMLQKAVISSGAASSANATTNMGSTAGQPVVGTASNSQMIVHFGFWAPTAAPAAVRPASAAMTLGLAAWPNPTANTTKLTVTLGDAPASLSVTVFDITGKRVETVYRGAASGTVTRNLDLSDLPAGAYIVAASIPGQLVEKRITVIR